MSCGFDQACLGHAVNNSVVRLSNGNPSDFTALRTNIAAGRGTRVKEYLDRADVDFIIEKAPEVGGFLRGMVAGGFMSHFDLNPQDGKITASEWKEGSRRGPTGVQLRRR